MPPLPSWVGWALAATSLTALLVWALPWVVGLILRAILMLRYGFRTVGLEHLPRRGPALLAANHVSWIDGFLVAAMVPRPGKAVVNASYIDVPLLGWLARRSGLIPVPTTGPKGQRAAIEAVRKALDRGEAVLIFPEAQLSRNGLLGPFYRGLEVMMKDRQDVPVLPLYLHNLWGSLFSYSGGRFFRKWPKGLRRRVYFSIGPPIQTPLTAFRVRQGVQAASVAAVALAGGTNDDDAWRKAAALNQLPHWLHPTLGLLTVSTPDFNEPGIQQTGTKPASLGQAIPGIALRAVNEAGAELPPVTVGNLQALTPALSDWTDTGRAGSIDREGFVSLASGSLQQVKQAAQETS